MGGLPLQKGGGGGESHYWGHHLMDEIPFPQLVLVITVASHNGHKQHCEPIEI